MVKTRPRWAGRSQVSLAHRSVKGVFAWIGWTMASPVGVLQGSVWGEH